MTNKEAIEYLKEVQSHIDLENGGNTQKMYDAIDMAIKALENARPTGQWIVDDLGITICSECKQPRRDNRLKHISYCNSCGAKMKEEAEND